VSDPEPVAGPDPVADELALRRLSDEYAAAVDRRDLDALRACFAPDARLVMLSGARPPREYLGHERLASVMDELQTFALTAHHVTTCSVALGSPETGQGTVGCVAHHVRSDGSDLILHIRYEDEYRRDAGRTWRIVERVANVLFSERRAVRLP